jgi:hypothetical protein
MLFISDPAFGIFEAWTDRFELLEIAEIHGQAEIMGRSLQIDFLSLIRTGTDALEIAKFFDKLINYCLRSHLPFSSSFQVVLKISFFYPCLVEVERIGV